MNEAEINAYFGNLYYKVYCKHCRINVERQSLGHHKRQKSHIENLHATNEDDLYDHQLLFKATIEYLIESEKIKDRRGSINDSQE